MNKLLQTLNRLITSGEYERIRRIVEYRIKEFKRIGYSSIDRIFIELSYCILTANYRADKTIKIQRKIWMGFLEWDKEKLSRELRSLGYRFPDTRADYIVDAREKLDLIKNIIEDNADEKIKRMKLKMEIRGLGLKESSHFLRNIGCDNLAIIDRHILKILKRYNMIDNKISINNRKIYETLESMLFKIANSLNTTLSHLDLYLWYLSTKTIMK